MVLSYAICGVSVAVMRREAAHRSECVSQILYGERVEILQVQDDYWAWVRSFDDDYEGWCLLNQLQLISQKAFAKEAKYLVEGHNGRLFSGLAAVGLPAGAAIKSGALLLGGHKAKFKGKKLALASLKPSAERIGMLAQSYLCAPYLWGGRSLEGIDCSGLSQNVFKQCGIQLPRDAAQQAKVGETISFLQEARCGDLAFFGPVASAINHVGILLGDHSIIHATESSACVVIDKIDQEGIVSKQLRKRTHVLRLIKRYF